MKFTSVKKLEPGMMLAKPIYDDRGVCLLAANKMLTVALISKMEALGYPGAFVFDALTQFEEYDEIISNEKREEIVRSLEQVDINKVLYLTNSMVNDMMSKEEILLDLSELRSYHLYTYQHSVNVSLLATACGIGLGLSRKELEDLAAAAVLHDIGKEQISKDILDKPGKLDLAEREEINRHPEYGYDMLYDHTELDANVRAGILCHHENWDGTGYPKKLKGEEIPLYARIIHIADVYDALCAKRAYKEEYDPGESLEYLMGNCNVMFDYELVKVFMKYVVVYPVGVDVVLSNGKTARVVKNHADHPLRPVVMVEHLDGSYETLDLAYDLKCINITILSNIKELKNI